MNQTDLKHKLSAPFDFNEWKNILAQMFPKIDYLAKETSVDNNLVKNGGQIGVIHLNDGRSLGLFKFEVADNIHISRNRKGLREIAAKYVDQDIINGALVLYYSGIQTEYRLTFVSKQTVFDSEGNLSIKETAPKRYTFLLGESEPCTTAANRLIELINKNKRGSVYLDDVTEAFSVERLNKDFFNGYKTQYKRFVDTLTYFVNLADKRKYAVEKCNGKKAGHTTNGFSLQEFYDDTIRGLIENIHKNPIVEKDVLDIFKYNGRSINELLAEMNN